MEPREARANQGIGDQMRKKDAEYEILVAGVLYRVKADKVEMNEQNYLVLSLQDVLVFMTDADDFVVRQVQ